MLCPLVETSEFNLKRRVPRRRGKETGNRPRIVPVFVQRTTMKGVERVKSKMFLDQQMCLEACRTCCDV